MYIANAATRYPTLECMNTVCSRLLIPKHLDEARLQCFTGFGVVNFRDERLSHGVLQHLCSGFDKRCCCSHVISAAPMDQRCNAVYTINRRVRKGNRIL